jgi:hypothetical protein
VVDFAEMYIESNISARQSPVNNRKQIARSPARGKTTRRPTLNSVIITRWPAQLNPMSLSFGHLAGENFGIIFALYPNEGENENEKRDIFRTFMGTGAGTFNGGPAIFHL